MRVGWGTRGGERAGVWKMAGLAVKLGAFLFGAWVWMAGEPKWPWQGKNRTGNRAGFWIGLHEGAGVPASYRTITSYHGYPGFAF